MGMLTWMMIRIGIAKASDVDLQRPVHVQRHAYKYRMLLKRVNAMVGISNLPYRKP